MKRLFTFLVALTATMVALPAFADGVDVTGKLVNPAFDEGIQGWSVVFTTKDNVNGYQWLTIHDHNEATNQGYFGLTAPTLFFETPQGVSPEKSSVSQKVKGLANGVYVFSAIGSFSTRYCDFEANGAFIFANENRVEGRNYCPYYNWDGSVPYAHTTRYQVAATVTDGVLEVGFCTIEGSGTYNADVDNCELWYFGDVKEEEALAQMGKIHMEQQKAITNGIIDGGITTDGAEALQTVMALAEACTTASEFCWAEDSLRIANYYSKRAVAKLAELTSLLETAKEVAAAEYRDELAVYQAQLKSAIELYEADIKANVVSSEMVNTYKADLQEMINQLKVDELYTLSDNLFIFVYDPASVTEDEPIFGITEHLGFGGEEGQFPAEYEEILQKLYEEVGSALVDFEDGKISATEVMAYIAQINAAVSQCIRNINKVEAYTLPYDWIAMPSKDDPTQPNTTIKSVSDEYIKANFWYPTTYYGEAHNDGIFRMQTPLMKFDKAYKQIVLTVTATVGNFYNTTNDGPYFGIQEMYVLDGEGNEIELTAENLSCNSMYPYPDSSLGGLVDKKLHYNNTNVSQFLTNGQSQANRGNHWICITFPEPVTEAKIIIETYYNDWWLQNVILSRVTISGRGEAESLLSEAIEAGSGFDYLFGLEPGKYATDDSELKALVAEGKAMLAAGTASETELKALADKITKAADVVKSTPLNKAVDGKEYYLSQEYSYYTARQGYKKHLTVLNDSILWFDDANPADKNQKWVFTRVEGDNPDDGYDWYTVQNVGTGKYMSTLITSGQAWEPTGEPILWGDNYMKLANKPTKVRLEYITWGNVRLWCQNGDTGNYMIVQAGAHNEGYRSTDPVPYGGTSTVNPNGYGLMGVCGPIIANSWQGGADSNCAWALREVVNTYPTTLTLSEQFGYEVQHFTTSSNTFTFTAEKPCAFDNFKVFDYTHQGAELSFSATRTVNSISITLNSKYADFRFTFDNKEGVKTLTITAEAPSQEKSAMEKLLEAYNAAPTDYVEGTEVGNVKSLTAFNAAIGTAERLLNNGGEEAEYAAAFEELEAAIAGLETVQPEAGKKYVIVNGYEAKIRSGQPIEYGIYFNEMAQAPGWTYLLPENENYQWQFEAGEEGTWYIMNVATGTYLGAPSKISEVYGMSETPVPYQVISKGGAKVNIRCAAEGSDANWNIHQNGFNRGFGTFGSLVVYNDHEKSRWYIREVETSDVGIGVVEDEMGRPVVQGVFDLTGRRVEAPAQGLYIINGQKVLVK